MDGMDDSTEPVAVLRAPRSSEAQALAALHVRCWRQTYSHLLPEEFFHDQLPARSAMWTAVLGSDPIPERLVVAEQDGELVGFAWAGAPHGTGAVRDLQLYAIYLDAGHHGSGSGQAMLNAVLGDAPAELWVAADNPRARAFYSRNGFLADGVQFIDADAYDMEEIRLIR